MQARCRYSDKLLCSYHYQKAYYSDPKFPERRRRISELNKSEQKRVRTDVMSILGGVKCKACECDDYTLLQIHHINGDGRADRNRFRFEGAAMWRYYRKHHEEAKQKLQVLCRSCNNVRNRKSV